MAKPKKKPCTEYGRYEITVMWRNEDRRKGDDIIEEIDICARKSYIREFIEKLPEILSLDGGKWKWAGKTPVYKQKRGEEGDHYITYQKVCL